ncbi:MAG: (2Fe-2S) ferredoxin domain-containing protein [Deltaproteobacteria bacterium]|nr:(2Fe-2S) ferredoxin domain-containing protein [Deltaproteobacteria bacterium]
MSRFEKHIFICINQREPGKACCAAKGSEEILNTMKEEVQKRGLNKKIRVNKAGCLDLCSKGAAMVVYPEGVWYGNVTLQDIPEIIKSHLIANRPVERLRVSS